MDLHPKTITRNSLAGIVLSAIGLGVSSPALSYLDDEKPIEPTEVFLYDVTNEAKNEILEIKNQLEERDTRGFRTKRKSVFYEGVSRGIDESLSYADSELERLSSTDAYQNYQGEMKAFDEQKLPYEAIRLSSVLLGMGSAMGGLYGMFKGSQARRKYEVERK
ncbi:MAG: hypothetical protein AABW73_01215 [Nanoarchaeota archaeon]